MDAPTDLTLYQSLGVAALRGLLVGLQRERVGKALGGLRTFALVTLLGAVCGVLARADGAGLGAWVVAAGLGAVAAVIVVSDLGLIRRGGFEPGMTTEMALVGMFLVGAVTTLHSMELGAALGGAVAILLYAKAPLQKIAGRLSEEDVRAIMQFVLITVIILPLLPDATYGPLGAINPRHLWLMVVLIVGIGLGAYIAQKFVDQRRGALVAGALGGLISSTATTVGAARMARQSRHSARAQATVIAVASAVVFIRVLIEIAAAAPQRFWDMAPPVGILLVVAALGALLVWSGVSKGPATPDEAGNPTRLTAALAFAALYAIMLLAVAWIQTTR
ncbi:MAG: MgtC/SapB family protein, partial [Phycisphaerales bacterium JB039]